MATGKEPPPRPKTFFVPDAQATGAADVSVAEDKVNDLEAVRDLVTKKGGGAAGKAFGKK